MEATLVHQKLGRIHIGLRNLAWPALAALTAAGAGFRLYLLGAKSIWLDEAFSVAISHRDLFETLRLVVLTDAHPPLYYLILNRWLALGAGEAAVRLLSALFSTASIPLMFFLARQVYGEQRSGLVGAAILAFSPFHVWYAQEARMYAMLAFLVLASACCFLHALRHRSLLGWIGFTVTTTLAAYTDYGALWFIAALGLVYWMNFRHFPGTRLGWLLSHMGIGLLYLPWMPFFVRQAQQVTESFWLPPPTFHTVLGTFLDFHSFNFPWMEVSIVYMAGMLVLAYIVPDDGGWRRPLFSLWLFAPLAISGLLSLRQPVFLSRNLIIASLGYYLLLVGVVRRFSSRRAVVVLLLPLLGANTISLANNAWFEEKEDWRAAAAYVARSAEVTSDGMVVFVPSYAELPFEYYFQHYDLALERRGYPGDELLLHPQPKAIDDLDDALTGERYVWLVLRDAETVDPRGTVKGWLDSHGYVRIGHLAGDDLMVITYFHWATIYDRRWPGFPLKRGVTGEEDVRYHRINPGETLSWIALRYGSTVEAIVEANQIEDPNRIYVGQELVVPIGEAVGE